MWVNVEKRQTVYIRLSMWFVKKLKMKAVENPCRTSSAAASLLNSRKKNNLMSSSDRLSLKAESGFIFQADKEASHVSVQGIQWRATTCCRSSELFGIEKVIYPTRLLLSYHITCKSSRGRGRFLNPRIFFYSWKC